jgi:hypothetical protein
MTRQTPLVTATARPRALGLRAGDEVIVRSEAEILATLDENGELDALPFMPEMLAFCGRRMTVRKVAVKTCDTVTKSGLRRVDDAVHLEESSCDGSAHGGCENACSLFWKEAWLERVEVGRAPSSPVEPAAAGGATIELLHEKTRREPFADGEERFACQATELVRASPHQIRGIELSQYVRDVRTGNVRPLASLRAFLVVLYNGLIGHARRVLPARLLPRGGRPWGLPKGRVTSGRTPVDDLGLQPGELVRIRSRRAIEDTLNGDLLNRGLGFDAEMARLCGREARVARRIEKVLDEKTGRMQQMKTPCIVLDGIVCEGANNGSCPRAWVCFWREIWLERVEAPPS